MTALRLQALAAVNGLTVYVPPAYTRQSARSFLEPDAAAKLAESDVLLGVIGTGVSEACRQELNMSVGLRKNTLVLADPAFAQTLQPVLRENLIVVDPLRPETTEQAIVERLQGVDDTSQNAKKALLAIGTLALGLLMFAPQD